MPVTDALFLSAVVVAFVFFGVVLAWGEYQTRHLHPSVRQMVGSLEKHHGPAKTAHHHHDTKRAA